MRFFSLSRQQIQLFNERKHQQCDLAELLPHTIEHMNEKAIWLVPEIPAYTLEKTLLGEEIHTTLQRPETFNDLTPASLYSITKKSSHTLFFPNLNDHFQPNVKLKSFLENRRLLMDELPFSIEEIHLHAVNGILTYEPGIITKGGRRHCQRCGNEDNSLFAEFACFRCKEECIYCKSCLMMGRVSSCSPLLTWKGSNKTRDPLNKTHVMAWDGTLSMFQQKASDRLAATIQGFVDGTNEKEEFLIWAVCGSGKTEMLFEGIKIALNQGLSVAIATPRTDVVLELEPRLKEAFPKTDIHAFYGGAKDRFAQAELVISTTHQLLRFYRSFDLVIIDEVDAFPYSADKKLAYAVSQAKKARALTVYVTATPGDEMKRKAEKGELRCAKVARRYHQHPLPEPRLQWIGQWKKRLEKGNVPSIVLAWLKHHLINNKQIFMFVPSVSVMGKLKDRLSRLLDVKVDAVHSADEERREKVMSFRKGETRVLVTTTILERGVTVKGVQVGVFGAEDRIFTESALVQIAGRAGRKPAEPTGDVVYFHYGKTKEMVKAIRHIRKMNELGELELLQERSFDKNDLMARGFGQMKR